MTASEHEVHIAKDALNATERGIEDAHERNRIATATHDALVIKLTNLKTQFREQIMKDGLGESNRWNEMYYKLIEWKENNNGDVLVPVDKESDEDTKKLSRWVINQRSAYKYFMNGDTKHIKDHRIDALNKVGGLVFFFLKLIYHLFYVGLFVPSHSPTLAQIGFIWSVADQIEWKENNNGDVLVPVDKESDEDTKKLSRWVINQRSAYKYFMNGDTKHIKDHRIDALNKVGGLVFFFLKLIYHLFYVGLFVPSHSPTLAQIGFIWSVADHIFVGNIEEMKLYHAENETFDIPVKTNKKLASFVSRVRTAYANKKEGRAQHDLTDDKIAALDGK